MSEGEGDIAVVLSSELIAKITQEYFNKVMFKQKVEIVDLKPASDGYMFSVSFVKEKAIQPDVVSIPSYATASLGITEPSRASNGKFTKKEKV